MQGVPGLDEVKAWLGDRTAAQVGDEALEGILAAELDLQARTLRLPADPDEDGQEGTYPPPLARALLRRVQREVAAKGAPLGYQGEPTGEFGVAYLRSWDPEIRRLEDPYRIVAIA